MHQPGEGDELGRRILVKDCGSSRLLSRNEINAVLNDQEGFHFLGVVGALIQAGSGR